MKKILNWLFGSFFRTIGRVFGFLAVVILLLLIGSKMGLKIPDFLMPMKISAAVYNTNWPDSNNINLVSWGGIMDCTSSSSCSSIGVNNQLLATQNKNIMYINSTEHVSSSASGGGYGFYYNTNYLMKSGYLYNITTYVCSTKSLSSLEIRTGTGSSSSDILTNATTPKYQNTIRTAVSAKVYSYCYAYQSLVVPGNDGQWFRTRLFGSSTTDNTLALIGYSIEGLGIYSNSIQEIITNSDLATNEDLTNVTNEIKEEQQNTTNAVEDMNDTINNNDTSGAQDSAGGFFDDFQSEDFGLSSIVTAPLRGINAMLNDTCVAPSATYKGQLFSLPCGSMLWNRPGGQDFKNFINIMYGGFLAYLVIRKFFLDVENLKNPDSDKVEVDKL